MVAAATPSPYLLPPSWPSAAFPIVAEIAERLCELDDLRVGSSSDLLHRLARLHTLSPHGYHVTLQLFHGNTSLLSSFSTQELTGELERIKTLFPELARTIREQRDRATHHEDPLSRNETNQLGRNAADSLA